MAGPDTGLRCTANVVTPTCDSTTSLDAGEYLSYRFSVTDQTSQMRTANIVATIAAQSQDDYRSFNNSDSYPFFSAPTQRPAHLSSDSSSSGPATFLLWLLLWPAVWRLASWHVLKNTRKQEQ